jgi:hypothetical protein
MGGKTAVKPNGLHPGWVGSEKPPERSEGACLMQTANISPWSLICKPIRFGAIGSGRIDYSDDFTLYMTQTYCAPPQPLQSGGMILLFEGYI